MFAPEAAFAGARSTTRSITTRNSAVRSRILECGAPTTPSGRNIWNKPEFAAACETATQLPGCREKEGQHLGFYAEFPTADKEAILLKVGISYVSIAGARENLAAEISGWDFDRVRSQGRELWARRWIECRWTGARKTRRRFSIPRCITR